MTGGSPATAVLDQLPDNDWGCGADNPDRLHLKSHWEGTRR